MTKNKICEWKGCDLVAKQQDVERFIGNTMRDGLLLLTYKYPDHNKDCLQRIYAERLKLQHHYLLGELIHKKFITKIEEKKTTGELQC